MIRLFRKTLFEAFFDWLETNRAVIGKWYEQLYNRGKDAEAICDTGIAIMGISMWMFNMTAECGVMAGLGPNKVDLQGLAEGLDRPSTMRLLHLISSCMNLQYLPKNVATQPIPIISAKKFSLKLFAKERELDIHGGTSSGSHTASKDPS